MATGDADDILRRVKAVIPFYWFAYVAPLRDAVLGGLSDGAAWCYGWIAHARQQIRIRTASGPFLDLIGWDFFGARFRRRANESDGSWRARILPEILRERGTRHGVIQAVADLTGVPPVMIEFTNGQDCGSYGGPYIGYGLAGHYGTLLAPDQALLQAFRPATSGIPEVPGYGSTVAPAGHVIGGYGLTGKYCDLSEIIGSVTDAMIYATVAQTQAAGVTIWTNIASKRPDPNDVMADFSRPQDSQYI